MLLPAVILLFVYSYLPMAGVVIAFQDFDVYMGIQAFWKSPWVGLSNFARLANMGHAIEVLRNTVVIAFLKIAAGLSVPIIVSLLLNEVRSSLLKRSVQTLIYVPNFVSWVILGGIVRQLLMSEGVVNVLIQRLGGAAVPFLQSNTWFVPTLIVTDVWKGFGFGTVIYLAAIAGIDPTLYEAAVVDGATRWQQTTSVTLPGMKMIIVLTAVLALQGVLDAGFDQVFNLYNVQVYQTGDIIDTFVYRITFESKMPTYHIGTAVGLFKSVVSFFFITLSYFLARKLANYEIF